MLRSFSAVQPVIPQPNFSRFLLSNKFPLEIINSRINTKDSFVVFFLRLAKFNLYVYQNIMHLYNKALSFQSICFVVMKVYGKGHVKDKSLVHWFETTTLLIESKSRDDLILKIGYIMGKIEKYADENKILIKGQDFVGFRVRIINEYIRCVKYLFNPVSLDNIAVANKGSLDILLLNEMEQNSTQFKNWAKGASVIPSGVFSDFCNDDAPAEKLLFASNPRELMDSIQANCSPMQIKLFEDKFLGVRDGDIGEVGSNWANWLTSSELDKRALVNLALNSDAHDILLRLNGHEEDEPDSLARDQHIVFNFHFRVELLLGPKIKARGTNQPLHYVVFDKNAEFLRDQKPTGYQHGACLIPEHLEQKLNIEGDPATHHGFAVPPMKIFSPSYVMSMFMREGMKGFMMKPVKCFYAMSPMVFLDAINNAMTLKRWNGIYATFKTQELTKVAGKLHQFHAKLDSYGHNKTLKRGADTCPLHTMNWEVLALAFPLSGNHLEGKLWRSSWHAIHSIIAEGGDECEPTPVPNWARIYEAVDNIALKSNTNRGLVLSMFPGFNMSKEGSISIHDLISNADFFSENLWPEPNDDFCLNKSCPGAVASAIFGNRATTIIVCNGDEACPDWRAEAASQSENDSLLDLENGKLSQFLITILPR